MDTGSILQSDSNHHNKSLDYQFIICLLHIHKSVFVMLYKTYKKHIKTYKKSNQIVIIKLLIHGLLLKCIRIPTNSVSVNMYYY